MIKIIYKSKPYYYENTGYQAYDIDTEIKIDEDANITDILDAVLRLLKFSTYPITKTKILNSIEDIFEDREEY